MLTLTLAGALTLSAVPVLKPAWLAAQLLFQGDEPVAVATFQLRRKPDAEFLAALRAALASNDADLAQSLLELAKQQNRPVPPELAVQVDQAAAAQRSRMAGEAWDGFVTGNAPSEAALAGSVVADLAGYGDVRDLYGQAKAYLKGKPVDRVTVAIAAVGLGLTAATVVSLGTTAPEKAGVSTVKAAYRAGRISPRLTQNLVRMADDAVDADALAALGRAARAFDPAGMKVAAGRLVRPAQATAIKQLGLDVATVGQKAGYRGTLDVLAHADDAAAVGRVAKVSEKFGRATRGTLALLGHGALTLASVMLTVAGWLAGAALWAAGLVYVVWRFARSVWRFIRRPA